MKAVVSRSMDPEAVARSLMEAEVRSGGFMKETQSAVQSVESSESGK